MISAVLRNLILSQLHGGIKYTQVVQTFKSVCSKCTITRILRESKSKKPVRKKTSPKRKIDSNMEKRIILALTVGKRPATIRGAAKKEKVCATTARRMLKRKGIKTFKKVKRFLITRHCRAPENTLWKISQGVPESRFEKYDVGG